MSNYGITHQFTMLDGSSANSAVRTSNPAFVGDATYISASYFTGAAVVSVVSVDASWSDGFTSALTTAAANNSDWLRYNSIATNPGVVSNLTVGPRWLRFTRSAADSQGSVVLTTRTS